MLDASVTTAFQQWADAILVWIGFGTVVGLLAKAVMPGPDPGGALATLAMGIAGTIIGCGVVSFVSRDSQWIRPISPLGFVVATGGAFLILFFYKLLSGYWVVEGDHPAPRRRRAKRRPLEYDYDRD